MMIGWRLFVSPQNEMLCEAGFHAGVEFVQRIPFETGEQ
jgi:hypothetical protein